MGNFADQVNGFTIRLEARHRRIFIGITAAVFLSIVFGSEITGAAGQPVDTGNLRASWIGEFLSFYAWQITTNVSYAQTIEDNLRGATLRSAVGGFHSVKKTVAGFPRIVESEVAKASGDA